MKWSFGLVFVFVFSLLAPPVMPIAEEEEKPMIVAANHAIGGFDRPIERDGENEDTEPEDFEKGDNFFVSFMPTFVRNVKPPKAQLRDHLYDAPDLRRNFRPPRV